MEVFVSFLIGLLGEFLKSFTWQTDKLWIIPVIIVIYFSLLMVVIAEVLMTYCSVRIILTKFKKKDFCFLKKYVAMLFFITFGLSLLSWKHKITMTPATIIMLIVVTVVLFACCTESYDEIIDELFSNTKIRK